VAEGDAERAFVGPYQLVALGRGEIVEVVLAAGRRFLTWGSRPGNLVLTS
jgi:hypothetical protein